MMRKECGYIPQMLSQSHFIRRLPRLQETWLLLFKRCGALWTKLNAEAISVIDRLPMAVCDNSRLPRVKVYTEARFRASLPRKNRDFSGRNVPLLRTKAGQPGEVFLPQGRLGAGAALTEYAVA
jgi:hypothetical protein